MATGLGDMITWRHRIVDPDNVAEAVVRGLAYIERSDFAELQTQEDLQRFFSDIIHRGKRRLAAKRKVARGSNGI